MAGVRVQPVHRSPVHRIGSGNSPAVQSRVQFDVGNLGCAVSEVDISQATDWSIKDSQNHCVIIHLQGKMTELATELDGRCGSVGPATAGEIWTVPASQSYASYASGGQIRFATLTIPVSCEQFSGLELRQVVGQRDDSLHAAVQQLIGCNPATDDMSEFQAEDAAEKITQILANRYSKERISGTNTKLSLTTYEARLIREFIGDRLSERIALEALSSLIGMKKNQLIIAFRNTFDATPAQYLISQRLRRAQWLLHYTRRDITQIALESGFSSHSHLTSCFAKRFGYPPSQFRARSFR